MRKRRDPDRAPIGGTERDKRLPVRHEFVSTIVESVADGLLLVDDGGLIAFVNPAAAALFGREPADLAGTEFGFPIVVGETTEIQLVHRGGGLITAELRVAEMLWEGRHTRLVSLRDITERKEADENARQLVAEQAARAQAEAAEKRAERLAEASRILASSLDYETTLASVAAVVVPTLGDWCAVDILTEDGTMRRLAVRHLDPEKERWAYDLWQRYPPDPDAPLGMPNVLRTGKSEFYPKITDDVLVRSSRDEEHLEMLRSIGFRAAIIVPLTARGRTIGAITLACDTDRCFNDRDVRTAEDLANRAAVAVDNARLYKKAQEAGAEAERARAEAEAARGEAEAANKAKSDFLATMSHELRTPLNAIGGYTQLMEEGVPGPITEKQKEYLARVRRSQKHLEGLINGVLNFAKLEAGRVEFDITDLPLVESLASVTALIEPQAQEKDILFDYRRGDPMVSVRADQDKLLQIILNLVSNAVKFTDPGGRIGLEWEAKGGRAEIRVSDTGSGIPAENLEDVFKPFVQLHQTPGRTGQGTGLGLAISRELARAMGGELTVESKVGEGSTFAVLLPLGTRKPAGQPAGLSR
ncbi:MAG: ATP-binding protein [Gemmatimonadaceae bacterium]